MSMTPDQIDAFTISVEQEIENEDYVPSSFTQPLLASLVNLDPAEKQEEYIRIAADLAYAFSGAMREDAEMKAAEAEAFRVAEEKARQERYEQDRRRLEERAEIRRQASRERYTGQQPSCGFPNCTLPGCYDGTYANANQRDGWRDVGYTTEPVVGYMRSMDQQLPDWERELLAPVRSVNGYSVVVNPALSSGQAYRIPNDLFTGASTMYVAPLDTPAPTEGDPVLGTAGEEPTALALTNPGDYLAMIADQEFYPRIEDPEVQKWITRMRDSINKSALDRVATAL